MIEKKYELIKSAYSYADKGCYKIKALKDFQLITGEMIHKGDFGGRVEGEHNLSQEGNCWISYYAGAFWKSSVKDNAILKDYSIAYDHSNITGNAVMKDSSIARDNATVSGNAVMQDNSCAEGNSIITGNAILQAYQCIKYGTVTTDLLGTKDWAGALYAELGVVPKNNKVILYKRVWSTDDKSVFKSDYHQYKIGETTVVENADENELKFYTQFGLHLTSLEFLRDYDFNGDTIIECEIEVPDIVTVQGSEVRARKCRVLRVYKEK